MKYQLFWKIFIGFFITFLAIVAGLWFIFMIYGMGPKQHIIERTAQEQLNEVSNSLKYGGREAADKVISRWSETEKSRLTITPLTFDKTQRDDGINNELHRVLLLTTSVKGADQQAYQLNYTIKGNPFIKKPSGPLPVPIDMLLLGIIGGILFSAGLAWYVVQPIHRLRWGFDQLAKGKLDVRLQKQMGKRRDEITDLAHDFDQMASQMEHLINSRSQLLHDVSHELRSPLARLNIAIALLQQNPSRMQEMLKRIESETHSMDIMIDELLTLFRVEGGTPQLDDYLDVKSLIYTVAQDAKFEADVLGILIQTNINSVAEIEEVSHILKGNAQLLRRALENVIRNAIRHSSSGQHVEINFSLNTALQYYNISIADRGRGVAEEKLSYMFEPFVRLYSSNDNEGFGLGLAIAYRAVLAHGGAIKAENRESGGLIVTIKLPFNI